MLKNGVIAASMSLLIFPGTGHVWLKKKKLGFGIIFASLAALAVVIVEITKRLVILTNDISSGKIAHIDAEHLTPYLIEQMAYSNNSVLQFSLACLLLAWIGSTLDALRTGLKET